jgi:flavin-dependent dehydrogenase
MLDYDVVVMGGGPAGASAALAATRGGLRTLLVEKRAIPRPKPCSGFLFSEALQLLGEYFGDIPQEARAAPYDIKGVRLYLPRDLTLEVPIPGRNIQRDRFDAWLCRSSGAELWDRTTLTDFAEWRDSVEVKCLREGEPVELRARVLIAADGNSSKIARRIDPSFLSAIPRYVSRQDWWRARVDLEPGYLNVFARAELGFYPAAYLKDDLLVMDHSVAAGTPLGPTRARFMDWVKVHHGLELIEPVFSLGCRAVFAAAYNRFCLGTDRVLLVGEAAGFQNVMGEGISSALATGYLAGGAAVDSKGSSPGESYRALAAPERERTAGEWRLTALLTGRARPELHASLQALPLPLRARVIREIVKWQWKGKMVPALSLPGLEVAVRRMLHGSYDYRA